MTDHPTPDNRIAIVGRAGRFPSARNVSEFWDLISAGRVATTRLSDQALLAAGVSRSVLADPSYVKAANILPDMASFDAGFFGFSPREAAILDPQHRHFLETCWEVLEDAGHMPEHFDGRVGIYAGSGMQAYLPYNLLSNQDLVKEIGLFLLRHTGNDKDFLTTRASYLLNLTGPSVAVQTACSTSLVAVHMAVNALLSFECDMALAGGVTIELPHGVGYQYAQGEILSPDGYCRAFDADSQGTVFGSGAAMVALRRMEDALADGDDIKAVILGSAINNDGSSKANYLAPSVEGQAEAASEAVAIAQVDPDTISYIEAHGTGTPIGDPIELEALKEVYGASPGAAIDIGSVKTNIGHLDTAAGTAGLIKVVEALRHKYKPATANFTRPNERFDFASSPFSVQGEGKTWPKGAGPRRAAINSLGVGGTNAHVILEEAPDRPSTVSKDCWRIIALSARDQAAIERGYDKWSAYLDKNSPDLGDVSFTMRTGRRMFASRVAIAARTTDDLKAAVCGKAPAFLQSGQAAGETSPDIVFMFPGGGAQYPGAGKEIYAQSKAFAAAVDECFAVLPEDAPDDLRQVMFECDLSDDDARRKLRANMAYAMPALTILGYAYARHWADWGINPDTIIAHSAGEYAGAVIAGIMSLRDALRIITLRGQVMDAAPAGAISSVPLGEEALRALVGDTLDIGALNAPELSVVSGRVEDVEALEARLHGSDNEAQRIPIDVAAHSRLLDGQLDRFRAGFDTVAFHKPTVAMVSTLRGSWGEGDDFVCADYWVRHLRHTVRFSDAVACVLSKPNQIILDMGPSQALSPLVHMIPGTHRPLAVLASAPKPKDDLDEMGVAMAALGGLWANGVDIDWERLPGADGRRISLPTYAFDKTAHWIEPGKPAAEPDPADDEITIDRRTDIADWFEQPTWAQEALSGRHPDLAGRWVVFAGDDAYSAEVLRVLQNHTQVALSVVRAADSYARSAQGFCIRPGAPEDYEQLLDAIGTEPATYMCLWPLGGAGSDSSFDTAYLLLRAMQISGAGAGSKLVFAAPKAVEISDLTNLSPDMQMLLGPVRVGPREVPGLETALVAIDCENVTCSALLAEAATRGGADEVSLSGADRFVRRRDSVAHLGAVRDLPQRLTRHGVYVVTGGQGGIGRELVAWLAKTAAGRIAILSRNAQPDPDLTRAVRDAGGDVAYVPVDMTDRDALEQAIAGVKQQFGPVNGVIHAAGTIADAPLSVKSLDDAYAVIRPKALGATYLDELFPDGSLDLFAVFSSSSVVIGPAGQCDYVAANAYIETLAARRSDGLSISWSIWRDIGMAANSFGAAERQSAAHMLLGQCQPDETSDIVYASTLDPLTDWVIAEHVVGGVPVLPGTAYLEIAAAAAAAQFEAKTPGIRSLSLAAPMVFADDIPRRVQTRLTPEDDGSFSLSIHSAPGGSGSWVEHATAHIVPAQDDVLPSELLNFTTPSQIAPRSGHAPQETLIDFGPRWKNVKDIVINDSCAEGAFALDEQFHGDLDDGFLMHPALIDMAMTVGLHQLSQDRMEGVVFAPVSFEKIDLIRPVPAQVTARAVRRADTYDAVVAFDVDILDEAQNPVLCIRNLVLQAIPGGALRFDSDTSNLTDRLLATGIRKSDAEAVFNRVFNVTDHAVIVAPVSLDQIRLAMTETHQPANVGGGDGEMMTAIKDPLAASLAGIWHELLGAPSIGPDDDFFALGGHSLNAVRLFNRIRKEHGVDLPLAQLYDTPTVATLAAAMREHGYHDAQPDTKIADANATTPHEDPPAQARDCDMTEGQREVLSAILSNPNANLAYNLSCGLKITGDVDIAAMQQAFERIGKRHDSLRAVFDPRQLRMVISAEVPFSLATQDLQHIPAKDQPARRDAIRHQLASTAFDLEHGPLLRASLLSYAPDQHEVLIGLHHMACDGWSIGIIMRDLCAFYNAIRENRPARLPKADSIVDFVAHEQDWLKTDQAKAHRTYWLDRFAGDVPVMDLPTDRPRPPVRTSAADRIDVVLNDDLDQRLRKMAKTAGASVENTIFAAFQLFLSHLTGSRDIVVGLPSAGQLSYGLEDTVGHCVNFLPIRSVIRAQDRFSDLLSQVRANLLAALDHQNYTYGTLMRDLGIARDPSRLALVPVIVNIDNLSQVDALSYAGLSTEFKIEPTGNELFEIFFNLLDAPGGTKLYWSYNTDLFDATTIHRYVAQFVSLLDGLSRDPGILLGQTGSLLFDTVQPSSGSFDDPGAAGPQTITQVFANIAQAHRDRPALRQGAEVMDYRTLDARSNTLAHQLAELGVQRGDLVGISSRRSLDLIVAVMGVLKAGAGYVPFDTTLPTERLRFMAQDTGIKVLIGRCDPVAQTGVTTLSVADLPKEALAAPKVELTAEDIAYVMYTSGTTGTPKGVVLPHRTVIRMLCDTDWLQMGPDTVTLHSSAFAFDTSIIDIFAALLHGGTVVIPPDGTLSIAELAAAVASHGVNTLWLTSGLFHAVADTNPHTFADVQQVIVGGDVVSPLHVKKVMDACPGVTVINGYGPTESNVTNAHVITAKDTAAGMALPIGQAIAGTQIFIVDENLNPVPAGIQGELCIAGRGVALGYWNRPDLTAEKFVAAPWDSSLRLYRSGDLAMDPGDGTIRFFGRKDTQVKIRGFRVEPLEIEAALEDHPAVMQAVVSAVVPDGQADKVLAAYFVPKGAMPSRSELAEHIRKCVPEFARPTFYVPVEQMPLNQNGKVDRKALPPLTHALSSEAHQQAQTETEKSIAEIWCEVLGLPSVSVDANFFDLGGHSLLAVRLFDKIRAKFSLDLPISTLFQNPNIRALATIIDERTAQGASADGVAAFSPDAEWDTSVVIDSGPGNECRPFFIVGGVGGNLNNLVDMARELGKTRPVIGFQTRGILGHTPRESITDMAAENLRYLKAHQPEGPYILAGYSGGAFTAFEMARQLRAQGDVVETFFVLDTFAPGFVKDFGANVTMPLRTHLQHEIDMLREHGFSNLRARVSSFGKGLIYRGPMLKLLRYVNPSYHRYRVMKMAWMNAASTYEGGSYDGDIILFKSNAASLRERVVRERSTLYGWDNVAPSSRIDTRQIDGDHRTMVMGEKGRALGRMISSCLEDET